MFILGVEFQYNINLADTCTCTHKPVQVHTHKKKICMDMMVILGCSFDQIHTFRESAKHTSGWVYEVVPQTTAMHVGERTELGRSAPRAGGTLQWAGSLEAIQSRRWESTPEPALDSS